MAKHLHSHIQHNESLETSSSADLLAFCTAITAVGLGFFSGWTLSSVPLTLAGASFGWLALAALTGCVGAALAWRVRPAIHDALLETRRTRLSGTGGRFQHLHGRRAIVAASVLAFAVAAVFFVPTSDARPLWAVCVAICLAGLSMRRPPAGPGRAAPTHERESSPDGNGYDGVKFAVLLAAIVAVYFFSPTYDTDDAFYLSLPISIKAADQGMMVLDAMHGDPDWPFLGSTYRVESLPTLVAAISWAGGIPVVSVAHTVLPLIWCVLYAAMLFIVSNTFFGRSWFSCAVLAFLFSLALGGSLQSYGAHSVIRFFHGKGVLVTVVVPLICFSAALATSWGLRPRKSLAILAALQLSAVGLTANGLYIAPLALGLTLAGSAVCRAEIRIRTVVLLFASLPLVLLGAYLLLFDPPTPNMRATETDGPMLALWSMFNQKYLLAVFFAGLLGASLAALVWTRGRGATAYVLVCAVLVFNPWLWGYFHQYVTGGLNFRLYWAVPIPFLLAVLTTEFFSPGGRSFRMGALLGAIALAAAPGSALDFRKGLEFSPIKVERAAFGVAQAANELSREGTLILAPESVAAWIPVMENHGSLVAARDIYLDQAEGAAPVEAMAKRRILVRWLKGEKVSVEEVYDALTSLCVAEIVVPKEHRPVSLQEIMERTLAVLSKEVNGFEIFRLKAPCDTVGDS